MFEDYERPNAIAIIAERKIAEAMAEGLFDNLPGRGRPQSLEDLSHLPEDMRLAYIILKNAGYLDGQAPQPKAPSPSRLAGDEGRALGRLERLKFFLTRHRPPAGARAAEERLEALEPDYVAKLLNRF